MTIDYSRAFAAAPEGFNRRIERTLARLEERNMRGISMKAAVVAAVILILLAGAALALSYHWGVLDFLGTNEARPTGAAGALVSSGRGVPPVRVGDATFTLTDAAYDGERVFVAVRVTSVGLPVQGEAWGDPGSLKPDQPVLTATLGELTADGRTVGSDTVDWRHTQDGTDIYTEYPLGASAAEELDIRLRVSLFDENFATEKTGALAFTLPAAAEVASYDVTTPIRLDGVTITKLDIRYTPFRLYTDVTYEIDPGLGKFDRMRREFMAFDLFDERGEPVQGLRGSSGPGAGSAWSTSGEWVLRPGATRTLTMKLTGRDGDPYGEYTIELGGENP